MAFFCRFIFFLHYTKSAIMGKREEKQGLVQNPAQLPHSTAVTVLLNPLSPALLTAMTRYFHSLPCS